MVPLPPREILDMIRRGAFIVAHPLALTRDMKIDTVRQSVLTRYYISAGADGIAIGVHTTQFRVHDDFERYYRPLLELTADVVSECEKKTGRRVIRVAGIVGSGEDAVREARLAWSLGYHAGLVSLHKLRGASEDRVVEFVKRVSQEIPVFGFYLQPAVGGLFLGPRFWRRLVSEIENMVAIKIAPFNRYYTIDVVRAVVEAGREGEVALYTGNDDNIIIDLLSLYVFRTGRGPVEARIVGGLLGHWAFWTRRSVQIFRFIKRLLSVSRYIPQELFVINTHVTDVNRAVFDVENSFRGSIGGVLEVLRRSGLLEEVRVLDPSDSLSPGQIEEIDRVYRMYPYLRDDDFVREYIDRWFYGECVGIESLRELTIEDIREMASGGRA